MLLVCKNDFFHSSFLPRCFYDSPMDPARRRHLIFPGPVAQIVSGLRPKLLLYGFLHPSYIPPPEAQIFKLQYLSNFLYGTPETSGQRFEYPKRVKMCEELRQFSKRLSSQTDLFRNLVFSRRHVYSLSTNFSC
jgi:hypothetical protein